MSQARRPVARTAAWAAAHWLALMASVLTLTVAGCVMQKPGADPGSDPMTITEDQIARVHATNAYEAVSSLHGDFLVSRGRESNDPNIPVVPIHVYVDDAFYGNVDKLRDIPAPDIAAIRLYQAYEAQYKFGSGNPSGVIQVITKH